MVTLFLRFASKIGLTFTSCKAVVDGMVKLMPAITLIGVFDITQVILVGESISRCPCSKLYGALTHFFGNYVVSLPIGILLALATDLIHWNYFAIGTFSEVFISIFFC